jgi:hypothetical protein
MMILTCDDTIINTNSVNKIYVERKLVPNGDITYEQFFVYADDTVISFYACEGDARFCVDSIFEAMEEGLETWSVKIFDEKC